MIEKSIVKVMLVIAWLLIVYKMKYSWIELSINKKIKNEQNCMWYTKLMPKGSDA